MTNSDKIVLVRDMYSPKSTDFVVPVFLESTQHTDARLTVGAVVTHVLVFVYLNTYHTCLSHLCLTWVRLPPIWDKFDNFPDQISDLRQNILKSDPKKSPEICPIWEYLTLFGSTSDTPDIIIWMVRCSSHANTRFLLLACLFVLSEQVETAGNSLFVFLSHCW